MGYSLAIGSLIIFVIGCIFFYNEFFSPTIILSISFLMASLFLSLYQAKWGSDFHFNTFFVIIGGLLLSFAIEFIIRYFFGGNGNRPGSNVVIGMGDNYVGINKLTITLTNIFAIIVMIVYYREMQRMASLGGYAGTGSFIYYARNFMLFHYNEMDTSERISPILNQCYNFIKASAHVYILIFINNSFARGFSYTFRNEKKLLMMPVLNYIGAIMIVGGKLRLAQFSLSIIVMYFFLERMASGKYLSVDFKTIKNLIISILAIMAGMRGAQIILGRMYKADSFIEFLAVYFGLPIELLNRYLQGERVVHDYIGQESFHYLYTLLDRLKLMRYTGSIQLEFVKVGNFNGNVYTGFRRIYSDFGYVGMVLLFSLMVIIISFAYYRLRNSVASIHSDYLWNILLYSYLYWVLVLYPVDNFFYSFVSTHEMITLVLMWVVYKLIVFKPIVIKASNIRLLG